MMVNLRVAVLLTALSCCEAAVDFPLKPSGNGRYLADQAGQPFFYQADTCWRLFAGATLEEATEYLDARREQGFSAIQVALAMSPETVNRAGNAPFQGENDLTRPNEPYFEHVEAIVTRARERGLLVGIVPLWAGCCREGWAGQGRNGKSLPIQTNGPDKVYEFGKWLGRRFARHPNVAWILGGDNDPHESREHYRRLALGLEEAAPHLLLTYHASSTHSSTDVFPGESWLDLAMVYTYFRGFNKAWNRVQPDVYEVAYAEYRKTPARPFILGESTYEGEHGDWGSPLQARKQAYWVVLSGGAGHAYGSPNWRFPDNWREILKYPGANSFRHMRELFAIRPWYRLVPDFANALAVAGSGRYAENDLATTAVAADGSFAITYFPSKRRITYDLSKLRGKPIHAWWFDPRTGKSIGAGTFRAARVELEPPDANDWVLVLDTKRSSSGADRVYNSAARNR